MKSRNQCLLALALSMAAICGCSHAPLGKDFNEANFNNINVQTINPQAGKDEGGVATLDGAKSEAALQRYRSGTGDASFEGLVGGATK